METGWKKVTDFLLICLSLWRAGSVTGWPLPRRDAPPSQGGCGLPSGCVSALPRSADRARAEQLSSLLRLCYNSPRQNFGCVERLRCDATRPGGQGCDQHSPRCGAGQELPLAHPCPGGSGSSRHCVRPPARPPGQGRSFGRGQRSALG